MPDDPFRPVSPGDLEATSEALAQWDVLDEGDTRTIRARLEQEIRAAWRADYRWLHVYRPAAVVDDTTLRTVASDEQRPLDPPSGSRYAHSYDLTELSAVDVSTEHE